jgi:hypothetical protein
MHIGAGRRSQVAYWFVYSRAGVLLIMIIHLL